MDYTVTQVAPEERASITIEEFALRQFRAECQQDDILERSVWAHVDAIELDMAQSQEIFG